jgi:hypothetical protein
MWVRIVRDRRLYPYRHHKVAVEFKAGQVLPIKIAWAEALIANGDAVETARPDQPDRS